MYFAHPNLMRIDLEVSDTAGGVEGVLAFDAISPGRQIGASGLHGSFRVKGSFAPETGGFSLTPAGWVQQPGVLATPLAMSGVLDPAHDVLAGLFDTRANRWANPYFALARAEAADRLILGPLKDFSYESRLNASRIQVRGVLGHIGGPDPDKVDEWASRLTMEHPDLNLNGIIGNVVELARNLFEDDYFARYFGKRFDELSPEDCVRIERSFQPGRNGVSRKRAEVGAKWQSVLGMFDATSDSGSGSTVVAVVAQRYLRSWRDDALRRLEAISADYGALGAVQAYRVAGETSLADLWPSERTAYAGAVDRTAARLAAPVLNAWIDSVIADASGAKGISTLLSTARTIEAAAPAPAAPEPGLGGVPMARPQRPSPVPAPVVSGPAGWLGAADPALRSDLAARLRSRADAMLPDVVATERSRLASLGQGVAALKAGTGWYRALMTSLDGLETSAPVREAMAEFEARRAKDLASGAPAVIQQVGAARTDAELQTLLQSTVGVPSDRTDASGQRIFAAASERTRVLAQAAAVAAKEKAVAQRVERAGFAVCKGQKTTPVAGEDAGAPSARDLCLAVASRFDAANEYLAGIAQQCMNRQFKGNPILAMQCLQVCVAAAGSDCDVYVQLTSFERLGCGKAVGKAGWNCDYHSSMTSSSPTARQMADTIAPFGMSGNARFLQDPSGGWMMMNDR